MNADKRRFFFLMITSFALSACKPEITDSYSFKSPSGAHFICVVEELQGANDPAPWWTHLSIKQQGKNQDRIPGNILKLKGRGPVSATWKNNAHVVISLGKTHFLQITDRSMEVDGVIINFTESNATK